MKVFVSLKLFATLKKYLPDSAERFAIAPGTTVRELAGLLGLPRRMSNWFLSMESSSPWTSR